LGRLVRNAVAEGGSTGAALQQGAIDFAATGHALNSMLQEASRSPGDPRYQNFTSLLFENMAKQDAARTDQGSEESA